MNSQTLTFGAILVALVIVVAVVAFGASQFFAGLAVDLGTIGR